MSGERNRRAFLAHSLLSFTVTANSGSATNRPIANVKDYREPFKSWRSTSTAAQVLVCDFGSVIPIAGIYCGEVNWEALFIERSNDGVGYTLFNGISGDVLDRRVGRRKFYVPFSADPSVDVSARYIRLTLGTLRAGETAFELGTLAFVYPVVWTGEAMRVRPLIYTRRQEHEIADYKSGGFETDEMGRPFLEAVLKLQADRAGRSGSGAALTLAQRGQAEMQALLDATIGATILYAEDVPQATTQWTTAAYLMRRVHPDSIEETFALEERPEIALREITS